MKTRKIVLGCLFTALGLFVLTVLLGLYLSYQVLSAWNERSKQKEQDYIHQQAICDTIKHIKDEVTFRGYGFSQEELQTITFWKVKQSELVEKDTNASAVFTQFNHVEITVPYDDLLVSDEIVIRIGSEEPLSFYVSGFAYEVDQKYGMFGYVGISECKLSTRCTVNYAKRTSFTLYRNDGYREVEVVMEYSS